MKISRLWLLILLVAGTGCDSEGVVRPPPTDVRMFNAAPNYASVAFLREERAEATFEFGAGGTRRFDSGPYDFHLDSVSAITGSRTRRYSFAQNLSPDLDYTVVAVAPGGVLQPIVVAIDDVPASETTSRFTVIHAHPTMDAVDVYMVTPGTPLNSVMPQGSIGFGSSAATFDRSPAAYRIYLTPVGDPSTVLFESVDFTVVVGGDNVVVIADNGGQLLSDFTVYGVSNNATRINRFGQGAEMRVVNGINDRLARDVILDDQTMSPLFPSQEFGEFSAYAPISTGFHLLTVTPVGMPGTAETVVPVSPESDVRFSLVVAGGTTNGIQGAVFLEDLRRIENQATLRFANAAGLFPAVEVFITAPGVDITTIIPNLFLTPLTTTNRVPMPPGDYEITVRDFISATVLAGPVPVSLEATGLYGFLLLNSDGGSTIDLEFFYDLGP